MVASYSLDEGRGCEQRTLVQSSVAIAFLAFPGPALCVLVSVGLSVGIVAYAGEAFGKTFIVLEHYISSFIAGGLCRVRLTYAVPIGPATHDLVRFGDVKCKLMVERGQSD